jgi:hypothetical protein
MLPAGIDPALIDFDEAERILCAKSFAYFVKRAWRHIIPDALKWNWHMDAICEHMQALATGGITSHRLLINVPPGSSKSTLVGVMYPAWLWGPGGQPWHRYIGAAHEQGLAPDARTGDLGVVLPAVADHLAGRPERKALFRERQARLPAGLRGGEHDRQARPYSRPR